MRLDLQLISPHLSQLLSLSPMIEQDQKPLLYYLSHPPESSPLPM